MPEISAGATAGSVHFDRWFAGASEFLATAKFTQGKGWKNRSAFLLHQATEQLYHCVLLVLTLYSPKSHKLNFLRSQAEQIAPALIEAWPREGKLSDGVLSCSAKPM